MDSWSACSSTKPASPAEHGSLKMPVADQVRTKLPKLAVLLDEAEEDVLLSMILFRQEQLLLGQEILIPR